MTKQDDALKALDEMVERLHSSDEVRNREVRVLAATVVAALSATQTPVGDDFAKRSNMAAVRALRELEQTAIMLERWAPELYPEINEQGQKHFNRVMMESAAEAIRDAWAQAISEISAPQSDIWRDVAVKLMPTLQRISEDYVEFDRSAIHEAYAAFTALKAGQS